MWPLGQIAAPLPTSCVPSACRPPSEIPCREGHPISPDVGEKIGKCQASRHRRSVSVLLPSPPSGTRGVCGRSVQGPSLGTLLTRTVPTSSCGSNLLTLMAAVLEEATRADTAVTNCLSCLYTNTFVSARGGERKGTKEALTSETRSY